MASKKEKVQILEQEVNKILNDEESTKEFVKTKDFSFIKFPLKKGG